MPWLFLAITGYLLLAGASFGDRFLLAGALPSPKLYTFFIGLSGFLIIPFLVPLGVVFPDDIFTFSLGIAAGVSFAVALIPYFEAIVQTEVSRVMPAVGAFVPIFTFLGVSLMASETLSSREIFALSLLISGGFLISAKKSSLRYFLRDGSFFLVGAAALLFALSFLASKIVFDRTGFVGGLTLILLGRGFAALALFGFQEVRDGLFHQKIALHKHILLPFAVFQSLGAIGMLLQALSVSLVKVSQVPLVNALEGTRYLFLFLFVGLAARWKPELLKEEMRGGVLWQKIIAGGIIIMGVALLAFW